eukprot:2547273-Rhodomonas_salina.2
MPVLNTANVSRKQSTAELNTAHARSGHTKHRRTPVPRRGENPGYDLGCLDPSPSESESRSLLLLLLGL